MDVVYDNSTELQRADGAVQPATGDASVRFDELNVGDRLCVQSFRSGSKDLASLVVVAFRPIINARNKAELTKWQDQSVFNTVATVDGSSAYVIQLNPVAATARPAPAPLGRGDRPTWLKPRRVNGFQSC